MQRNENDENEKPSLSNSSGLKSVFEKATFSCISSGNLIVCVYTHDYKVRGLGLSVHVYSLSRITKYAINSETKYL